MHVVLYCPCVGMKVYCPCVGMKGYCPCVGMKVLPSGFIRVSGTEFLPVCRDDPCVGFRSFFLLALFGRTRCVYLHTFMCVLNDPGRDVVMCVSFWHNDQELHGDQVRLYLFSRATYGILVFYHTWFLERVGVLVWMNVPASLCVIELHMMTNFRFIGLHSCVIVWLIKAI